MNRKTSYLVFLVFLSAVTFFSTSAIPPETVQAAPAKQAFGLQQSKEGARMVKKRMVSSGSLTQVIDKNEDMETMLHKYPKVRVVATGYYAGYESTGKTPSHPQYGITYSGVKVRRGTYSTIAADLRVFPLGTILYIPGYGYGVVADKGGAIRGNKIDLYFETKADVYAQWGKRTVDVYVVHKGDGKITEPMLQALNDRGVAAMAEFKD